mmetsp:Transcript_13130/g.31143  ORF Transcript_13130/g.31143 Transcript_13130/m.31143 type:complete len:210 (-) Transcript_13130:354-983(-)
MRPSFFVWLRALAKPALFTLEYPDQRASWMRGASTMPMAWSDPRAPRIRSLTDPLAFPAVAVVPLRRALVGRAYLALVGFALVAVGLAIGVIAAAAGRAARATARGGVIGTAIGILAAADAWLKINSRVNPVARIVSSMTVSSIVPFVFMNTKIACFMASFTSSLQRTKADTFRRHKVLLPCSRMAWSRSSVVLRSISHSSRQSFRETT